MQLDTLIKDLPITLRQGAADVTLAGLTDDSRQVALGTLFIARPGIDGDALRFVPAAIQSGAAALLLPLTASEALAALKIPESVAVVVADADVAVDQRLAGQIAERFYDHPSKKLKLIGVTGTNGKTTTITIAKHLLESAGHKTGLIGTVQLDTGSPDGPTPATLTTPGAIDLSRLLAEMVSNGCTHCVMEVSSHALHQGRADHVRFAAAAFTNLTQDHLDYHGDMAAYADAKAILFDNLDVGAKAVCNRDDPATGRMLRKCNAFGLLTRVEPMGTESPARTPPDYQCFAIPIELTTSSSRAEFIGPWGRFIATVPIPGGHNLSNTLQAAALMHSVIHPRRFDLYALRDGIGSCKSVPGRLEPVDPDWPAHAEQREASGTPIPTVLVDYAHTPDALINVGKALRELTQSSGNDSGAGKLITVFGCGGDRDRAKRPLMAQAAQQYADIVVLTSDNPRTEDPQQILNDAAKGFITHAHAHAHAHADAERSEASGTATHVIADRAEAIRFAINLARQNDTVLIAGKGHEDYQIIGTTKHHFDDREHAAAALREKAGQQSR